VQVCFLIIQSVSFSTSLSQFLVKLDDLLLKRWFWICFVPNACQCYTVLNHVLYLREINDHLNLLLLAHLWSYFSLDLSLLSMIAKTFFHFLPNTCQIDIRTAKFIQGFIANDNSICRLLSKRWNKSKEFFSSYDNASSISELKIVVENLTTLFACVFVWFPLLIFVCCQLTNKAEYRPIDKTGSAIFIASQHSAYWKKLWKSCGSL